MLLRNCEALRSFVGKGRGRIMSGAELARKIGRSRSTVDHLLNGRMESCTPEVAMAIEEALGVPSGIIFVTPDTMPSAARHNTAASVSPRTAAMSQ